MTTGSIGPGTVLAGRYRLDDLLSESRGARFWRATDTILARSVAIHALPSEDPRAPGLLDAARVSATVVDTHLLRVLDCDDEDGITWVVNEWGDGISLDLMLQQGTLPPSRAAWLAREVAEAIAAGHAQGVAHGRLNPEAVLVTHSGAVKLIGYVVDASLQTPADDPLYGELDDRESDVINLAGILYAALTGRWPGVAPSSVPAAPREARRPLRPRQVRAGVPRTLDAICDRVLHKEASLHAMPIETAHEIAAALADYVGDPALTAPLDASGIHTEPPPTPPREDPAPLFGVPGSAAGAEGADVDLDAGEPTALTPVPAPVDDPDATQLAVPLPPAAPSTPETTDDSQPPPDEPGTTDQEDTQLYRVPTGDWGSPGSSTPAPPPPSFPDTPERPLFADTERRVPASARVTGLAASGWAEPPRSTTGDAATGSSGAVEDGPGTYGGHGSWHATGHGTGHGDDAAGFWPFDVAEEDDTDHRTGKEGRGWLRTGIAIGVLLVLLVAVAVFVYRGREDGGAPSDAGGGDPSSSPSAQGRTLELSGVSDFDPESDDPEENPDEAPNAIDGDPATSWRTSTYFNDPKLGGLKSGVGLVVDLGSPQRAASVTVRLTGSPTSFEVYAAKTGADAAPETLDGFEKVGAEADAGERATVRLDPAPRTRYLLVWLTELPAVPDGFRGEISEISVRS